MYKFIAYALLIIVLSIPTAYSMSQVSQASNEDIDLDEVDSRLFQALKQELGQSDADVYQAMAWNHIKKENWERAATYFKKAVGLDPQLYWSWYNLGLLYIDTEEGNKYFKKAIDANSDYPPSYYWLAYIYCKNRDDKQAIKLFKQYLEVADGMPTEEYRYKKARRILAELFSGREGKELWRIRKLDWQ